MMHLNGFLLLMTSRSGKKTHNVTTVLVREFPRLNSHKTPHKTRFITLISLIFYTNKPKISGHKITRMP